MEKEKIRGGSGGVESSGLQIAVQLSLSAAAMAMEQRRLRDLLGVLIVSAALGCASARAAGLRVVGSDLLGVEFSKAMYEFAGRSGVRLALAFDGSRPGLDVLSAARADAALLVLPPDELGAASDLDAVTVAFHSVVVLVPADCPLEQITLEQLAGVFGGGAGTSIARWSELQLGGDWAQEGIIPFAPEVGTGIALEFFRHAVLGRRELKPNVRRYAAPAELGPLFSVEKRAIAITGAHAPAAARAKVLAVARGRAPAFLPTAENLHAGDYPLGLPLQMMFRRGSAVRLRPLLEFLFGDTAAAEFERAGLVPLPAGIRAQQADGLPGV